MIGLSLKRGSQVKQKLKVGSSIYELIEAETEEFGRCEIDTSKIVIRSGLGGNQKAKTLFHEVLHAIVYEYAVPVNEVQEEELIRKLESGICGFIIDNPKLFDALVKDLRSEWK